MKKRNLDNKSYEPRPIKRASAFKLSRLSSGVWNWHLQSDANIAKKFVLESVEIIPNIKLMFESNDGHADVYIKTDVKDYIVIDYFIKKIIRDSGDKHPPS